MGLHTADSKNSGQVDYAPPVTRRQRLTRPILLLLLVATAAWATYAKREQFALLYRQWKYRGLAEQCLNYTAPANQVMYEEDPTRAAVLLARPGYAALWQNTGATADLAPAGNGTIAGFMPECWRRFEPYTRTSGWPSRAVLFLHERRTPSGARRLVVVEVQVFPDMMQFAFDAIDLDECRAGPRRRSGMATLGRRLVTRDPNYPMNLRIFAGQPDPVDPTHFSLPFEWNGRTGAIEVYLTDDPRFSFRVDSRGFYY